MIAWTSSHWSVMLPTPPGKRSPSAIVMRLWQRRLKSLGPSSLETPSRFAETFLPFEVISKVEILEAVGFGTIYQSMGGLRCRRLLSMLFWENSARLEALVALRNVRFRWLKTGVRGKILALHALFDTFAVCISVDIVIESSVVSLGVSQLEMNEFSCKLLGSLALDHA